MTADASGIIIDTSVGMQKVEEITSFQNAGELDAGDERRAKIRQKMLELEKLQREEAESKGNEE